MKIVLTGANGFIGTHVTRRFASLGHTVQSFDRRNPRVAPINADVVIHLAGVAHRTASESEFIKATEFTKSVIDASHNGGVKHFIFVSSIAAQTDATATEPIRETDIPRPTSIYGREKLASERYLIDSGVPYTILRPVAVFGEGAKGNPRLLQKLAGTSLPLPIANLKARRSILTIDDLNSAIMLVIESPRAKGRTFIVADPLPVTVPEIISKIRRASGARPNVIPFPIGPMRLAFKAVGLGRMWDRIDGMLVAKPDELLSLGWKPKGLA